MCGCERKVKKCKLHKCRSTKCAKTLPHKACCFDTPIANLTQEVRSPSPPLHWILSNWVSVPGGWAASGRSRGGTRRQPGMHRGSTVSRSWQRGPQEVDMARALSRDEDLISPRTAIPSRGVQQQTWASRRKKQPIQDRKIEIIDHNKQEKKKKDEEGLPLMVSG